MKIHGDEKEHPKYAKYAAVVLADFRVRLPFRSPLVALGSQPAKMGQLLAFSS